MIREYKNQVQLNNDHYSSDNTQDIYYLSKILAFIKNESHFCCSSFDPSCGRQWGSIRYVSLGQGRFFFTIFESHVKAAKTVEISYRTLLWKSAIGSVTIYLKCSVHFCIDRRRLKVVQRK
jgi:hypothetical protein